MARLLVGIGTGVLNVVAAVGGLLGQLLVQRNNDQIVLRNNDTVITR